MHKNSSSQKGQSLIIIALSVVGLIGLVALAIDGGNAFLDRRNAQNAADAAALSAAYAKISSLDYAAAAQNLATSNGYTNDGVASIVTVANPPGLGCDGYGPYAANDEYIQVIIRSNVDTYFAPVVGIQQIHNCVEAIARARPSYTAPLFDGSALVSLNPNACKAFRAHGNSSTTILGSGIFVNSNSNCGQGAFNHSGNARVESEYTCVIGSFSYTPGKVIPPPTHSGCEAVEYPPEIIYPTPQCADDATRSGNTWTPGNIDGSDFRGTMILLPGVYCISGDMTVSGHANISGDGVLLYLMDGRLHFNGSATFRLSAPDGSDPDTEDYAGLLIYAPLTNSNSLVFNGNSSSYFFGTIFAPASDVQINGTGDVDSYHTQVVAYTVDLIGNADTVIRYSDSEQYDATIPPSIELVH